MNVIDRLVILHHRLPPNRRVLHYVMMTLLVAALTLIPIGMLLDSVPAVAIGLVGLFAVLLPARRWLPASILRDAGPDAAPGEESG